MPSPFPGMDPYLEGYLWPDVHHRLASEIARQLGKMVRPHYVARLEITVVEDVYPEVEIGLMYPDVEIVAATSADSVQEPLPAYSAERVDLTAPLTLPLWEPVPVRVAAVEIRDAANNELITSIEILPPVNKREPGLGKYREKQRRLRAAGVHLLEIDLLRRGLRPLQHPQLPESDYLISLFRAHAGTVDIWPIRLSDSLPLLPVPLRQPDPDTRLDLSHILQTIYDEAGYDLSLDYTQAPPSPPVSPEISLWMQKLLSPSDS